jgi:hypothetical protein
MYDLITKVGPIVFVAILVTIAVYVYGGGFAQAEEVRDVCCSADEAKSNDTNREFTAALKEGLKKSETTIACNITDPKERKARKKATAELFAHASNVKELEDGYRMNFDSAHVELIVDYIEAERECCPFFAFQLSFPPSNAALQLDITGPPLAKEMLKPMNGKK